MERIQYNPDETIDEVVMTNAWVHLEQLDDKVFMLIVENENWHWHMRVGAKKGRGGKVDAWMYEDIKKPAEELLLVANFEKAIVKAEKLGEDFRKKLFSEGEEG